MTAPVRRGGAICAGGGRLFTGLRAAHSRQPRKLSMAAHARMARCCSRARWVAMRRQCSASSTSSLRCVFSYSCGMSGHHRGHSGWRGGKSMCGGVGVGAGYCWVTCAGWPAGCPPEQRFLQDYLVHLHSLASEPQADGHNRLVHAALLLLLDRQRQGDCGGGEGEAWWAGVGAEG